MTVQVYDNGSIYAPEVLNIKPADLLKRFLEGVTNVASVSLAIKYPTVGTSLLTLPLECH
jgi:large subunit ribosomal protein LP0